MSKVEIELTAKEQQMVAAWKRGQQSIAAFNRELDKVGGKTQRNKQQGDRFFKSIDAGVTSALTRFVGVGAAIAGIGKAASIVRQEYDNLLERQKTAADRQIDTARAQRGAIQNLGDDPTLSVDQLNKRVADLSVKSGVSQGVLFGAASNVFSAKGKNISAAEAFEAVAAAAELSPDDPAGLQQSASAILALKKKGGGTAREIAGFNIGAQQTARVESAAAFAQNIAPAIAQLTDFGDTRQQAAALLSTITQGAEDSEGRVSATASIKFAKQLKELLPEMESTTARLQFIQSDDPKGAKVRKKLLGVLDDEATTADAGGLKSEAKTFTTLTALLQAGQNDTKRLLQESSKGIPTIGAASEAELDKFNAKVNSQNIQQTAAMQRALSAASETIQIGNTQEGRAAVVREGLDKVLSAAGESATKRRIETLINDVSSGGQPDVQLLMEKLREEQAALASDKFVPQTGGFGIGGGSGPVSAVPDVTASPQQLQDARFIGQLIETLELINSHIAAVNDREQPPINVNVRVQQPAGKPQPARGAAALGVQGG